MPTIFWDIDDHIFLPPSYLFRSLITSYQFLDALLFRVVTTAFSKLHPYVFQSNAQGIDAYAQVPGYPFYTANDIALRWFLHF